MELKELNRLKSMLEIEDSLKEKGYKYIAGVDEAGRGPLCGPVFVAAVVFEDDVYIEGLNDSKKISEKKREKLYDEIISKCLYYSVKSCDVDVIEDINILNATKKAMKQAVEDIDVCDYALIDGNQKIDINIPFETVVKGDSKSLSIAAASILAKVSRDRLLYEYDKLYPEYGFSSHKGYGTKKHIEAIKEHGICDIHRKSFCKKFV